MSDEKFLNVTDTSATAEDQKRTHHVFLNGELKAVDFEYGKPTVLPYELGAKFLLPGFIVKDADDQELVMSSIISGTMADDEVIARLSELKDDALLLRAISRIGGEKFMSGDEPTREALINFLVTKPAEDVIEDDVVELVDDEDGEAADVQDDVVIRTPSGIVPDNAEDEITIDVGTDEAPAATPEITEIVVADNAVAVEDIIPADVPAVDDKEIVASDEEVKA